MSLYDYFTGEQSWKDHVNNRDLGLRFESALTKSTNGMTLQLKVSEQQRALAQGLGSISHGLISVKDGFSDLRYEIADVSAGIDHLRADFNVMMGDVIWKLELQGNMLADLLRTLQAPLDTAARELRARAEDAYRNGWYEEALGDFLQSEQKNYQDFSVQRSMANIYLYHLVDLPKASEYFAKAAKYARPRDSRQAAEAEYFIGIVCGLEQKHENGLFHFAEAVNLNSAFLEAHYMHASFSGLLGRAPTTATSLEAAIKGDPRYYPRCVEDPCFDKVRDSVEKTLDGLRQRQGVLAKQNLDYLQCAIRAASEFDIGSIALDEALRDLEKLKNISVDGTYVECTTAAHRSCELAKAVVDSSQTILDSRIKQLRGQIEQRKATLKEEIQRHEWELSSNKSGQSKQKSPAGWILIGMVVLVGGVVLAASGNVPFGIITGVLGGIFLIAGLGHASQNGRVTERASSLETAITDRRSLLDQGRDSQILSLADRIRIAESGKRSLATLRPVG